MDEVPGDISAPPSDVREDGDVDLFMSIKLEMHDMSLKVTIGNDVVARYLFQKRDNYTVIGSSIGSVAPRPFPFPGLHGGIPDGAAFLEDMLAQGWQSSNQQLLLDICADDEHTYLPKNGLSLPKNAHVTSLSSEGTQSSTNSSAAPLDAVPPASVGGVISLDESLQPPL